MLLRNSLFFLLLFCFVSFSSSRRGGGFRSGGGGGWFSRGSSRSSSGSSSRGGWFSRSRSTSSNRPSSSYPKQQWGSSRSSPGSSVGGSRTNVGGSRSSVGGGGFVNPRTSGSNAYKTNPYGTRQYSGYSSSSMGGVHSYGGKSYGYRTPGYGTSWGTNFAGAGRYSKGYSGKALGLGVAAGFLGGAALSSMGTMAMYSVYHRYAMYQNMMYMNNPGMYGGYNRGYHNNYYNTNTCRFGCPMNTHCEWGFCECNAGTTRRQGQCMDSVQARNFKPRQDSFDPFQVCRESGSCQKIDMNLVCNTNLTTQGDAGKCECRQDMKWNTEAGECQIFLDVDCSAITYDTQPSATILTAVEKAKAEMDLDGESNPVGWNKSANAMVGRTESANETLANSLLTKIDPKNATADEIKEAFCRDIDSFSFEMEAQPIPELIDERPSQMCSKVPRSACAIGYDSHDCSGGWKLIIPEGQLRFRWFTSYWKYRNDMDTVGIRAGCTIFLYTDSDFTGNKVRIDSYPDNDRWVVLGDHGSYTHMDADVEAVQCHCNIN